MRAWDGLNAKIQSTRMATGEHESTRYGFELLADYKAVDIWQPDMQWCGGLTELRWIDVAGSGPRDPGHSPRRLARWCGPFRVRQPETRHGVRCSSRGPEARRKSTIGSRRTTRSRAVRKEYTCDRPIGLDLASNSSRSEQMPRSLSKFPFLFREAVCRPKVRMPCLVVVAITCIALAGCPQQAGFPNRPIVLICPWAAGGGTDRVSRQTAAVLEQELGVPVNVVNAAGGGGVTGHTRGALARPDGYTLTMVTVEINMLHWRGLTNISHEDFDPVGLVNFDAAALFVRSDAPWQDLAALQEYAKSNTSALKASGTANGGIWHLAFAGWLDQLGLNPADAIWLPNNGAAPSLQELLAGGIDVVCCSLPEAQSLLDSGRVRCLGVMADEPVEQYPDVPTLKQQGVDWTMTAWRGVCVPRGTPPAVTARLTRALEAVALSGTFREFMRESGFHATWKSGPEFRHYMEDVDERLGKLIATGALSFEQMRIGPKFFPGVLGAAGYRLGSSGGRGGAAER